MIDAKALGKRIESARSQSGLTQAEVGKKLGLDSGQQVSRWEGGGGINLENLSDLAAILNVSLDYLVRGDGIASPTAERIMEFGPIRQAVTEYHLARSRGAKPQELAAYRRIVISGIEQIVGSVPNAAAIIESFTRLLLDAGEPISEQADKSGAAGGRHDA